MPAKSENKLYHGCTVRVFWQKVTLEDVIGSTQVRLKRACVRPMSCYPPFLPVHTVNCVQTLKVWCEIDDMNATFQDILILEEGQRRLRAAVANTAPFFMAVGFHKPRGARF
jgi:hypothetical protein